MSGVSAIILAAGFSRRMGELKPLLQLGGQTFLERAVGSFAGAGIADVIVVTGHRGGEVREAAKALGVRAVANPRYEKGMYTSIQAGAAAVEPSRDFLLLPVDCPLVRPETVGLLVRTGRSSGAEVVVPACGPLAGHPPFLAASLLREIIATDPPGGLRDLLAGHAERTIEVQVRDPGTTMDADTPEDLARLRDLATAEDLPSEERCAGLLREHGASDSLIAHSRAVAAVAAALATALNERDQHLCIPLVVCGALLHDIARDRPRHATAGAAMLERLGYRRVAHLVRVHTHLGAMAAEQPDEAQVVYLADKLVKDERLVTLDERFALSLERFAGDPAACAGVLRRREEAVRVRRRIEAVLGRPLGGEPGA